ncbi:MAG: FAD-dependent oxidoreductase [Burkholderiaceae bacterium]|nr:FAD-dependent oxidoreductase [Burkholderiaceae bacterium]
MPASRQPATNPLRERVVVVGAGVGGLVAACELAHRGVDVTLVERAAEPGGKMRRVPVGDTWIDGGPTVFTMRWVFDRLFDDLGVALDEHLRLQPLRVLARHAWSADERFDLGFRAFVERGRAIFRTLDEPFMRSSRPNPVSLAWRVGLRGLPGLLGISPFTTLWRELGRYFPDPRLGRYATYCGASPFHAPATLMLVAHVEQEGVWAVDGGMHRIAQVLAALAERAGARLRFGCEVREIVVEAGRARGVRLADGETLPADAVVFNGDVAALGAGLLGDAARAAAAPVPAPKRSLSAVTWNAVARTAGFPLVRHTVFFSDDYPAEFAEITRARRLPTTPTVYVCAQDRDDDATAPPGAERLLVLVNAPADGDHHPIPAEELAACEARTFRHLAACGLQVSLDSSATQVTTPSGFHRLFPGTGGALYGQASHGWQASFTRPGAASRIPGLMLAGGSVHPGPGVPMAALSGRLAASRVLDDLRRTRPRSTAPWPKAATPGGMSTP